MIKFLLIWSSVATVLATGIMSYITMATAIGPWIETVIVLLGTVLVHLLYRHATERTHLLGLSTAAAGMGGIIATACGFSFPTLYFLEPELFRTWLSNPLYFCTLMALLVLAASSVGLLVSHGVESTMLADESMTFSVGHLVEKMIVAQNQIRKAYELLAGIAGRM